jgi:hypothetical protein
LEKQDSHKNINGIFPCVTNLYTLIELVEKGAFLIVNNVLIKNRNEILFFFKEYKNKYHKLKYYSKEEAKKKWDIFNEEGILFCKVKKIIISLE